MYAAHRALNALITTKIQKLLFSFTKNSQLPSEDNGIGLNLRPKRQSETIAMTLIIGGPKLLGIWRKRGIGY